MQAGTMYVKIVPRKIQGPHAGSQYILLAGFTRTITHNNADYMETLSPAWVLKQEEITNIVAKLKKLSNAADVAFVTNDSVQKKLDKLFNPQENPLDALPMWAKMKLGTYMNL